MARPRMSPPEYGTFVVSYKLDERPLRLIRVSTEDQRLLAPVMSAEIKWQGFDLIVQVELDADDRPHIRDFRILDRGDGEPITGTVLRRLPMSDILDRIVDHASMRVAPEGTSSDRLGWTWAPDSPLGSISTYRGSHRDRDDPERASAALRRLQMSKRDRIEDEAREVAEVYNAALRATDPAPIRHVERVTRLPRRTVQRRKELAISLGLIEGEPS